MKKIVIGIIFILSIYSCKKETVNNTNNNTDIISWEDIEAAYSGYFTVPKGDVGEQDQNFHFSSGAFCMLDKKTIFLEGHTYSSQIRQLSLPETLNGAEATPKGEWFDPTDGLLSTGQNQIDYYKLGDLLIIKDRIYFTKHQWYNAGGEDFDSFGYRQKGNSSFADGKVFGLWNADHPLANNMRIGGYLSYAPDRLKKAGVTFLAGQEGLSGSAMGRWGLNLFAVKFDDSKPKGAEMEVIPLIVHAKKEEAPEDWWVANRIYSVVWIETPTKRGVAMLFLRGYGDTWYGDANDNNPPDPYGGYKGYHSTGKQFVAWIYDPDDLMKVYNGEVEPHTIKPKHKKVLIDLKPGDTKGMETYNSFIKEIKGGRMDMCDDRLIIMQPSASDLPKGYVVDF